MKNPINKDLTVEQYIASVPLKAKPVFDELRAYILKLDSKITESVSYGILGFYLGKKKFYIGGYKTHVGLYPGPTIIDKYQDKVGHLREAKGTLHLALDKKIPYDLIENVIKDALGIK